MTLLHQQLALSSIGWASSINLAILVRYFEIGLRSETRHKDTSKV
jgi:hypothetical protein